MVSSDLHQYKIKLENFYGPLDLLLYLIREDELDPLKIELTNVIDQYIAFIELAKKLDISLAGEFISLAAQLLVIKTRRLMPEFQSAAEQQTLEEEEISIDLIRKLLEYRKYKRLADHLLDLLEEHSMKHPRPAIEYVESGELLREIDLWQIVSAYARLIKETQLDVSLSIIYSDIPIGKLIEKILIKIKGKSCVTFSEIVSDRSNKSNIIANLLAVLELVKQQVVETRQLSDKSDIIILQR